MDRASGQLISGRYANAQPLGDGRPGHFAMIFEADDRRTNKRVILKFLHPEHSSGYRSQSFDREASIAQALVGKDNVVQLAGGLDKYEVTITEQNTGVVWPWQFRYFALERARGNLTELIFGRRRPRSLQRRLFAIRDIVRGVNRLHRAGYCHRDLKPDNCLIFSGGVVKISDFGTCRPLTGEDPLLGDYLQPVGSRRYAPPEAFCGAGNRSSMYEGADWFAVGAIMFEVVTNQNLYVAIGLRNVSEIVNAFSVGDIDVLARQVSQIAGNYPIPATADYNHHQWLAKVGPTTHEAVTNLIRSLCHFDWKRRLVTFPRILGSLDVCILKAGQDIGQLAPRRFRKERN